MIEFTQEEKTQMIAEHLYRFRDLPLNDLNEVKNLVDCIVSEM